MAVSTNVHSTKLSKPCIAEVVEGLLHGLSKPLPEAPWVEGKEFLVKSTSIEQHLFLILIAVRNTQETGHLVDHNSEPHP